MRANCVLRVELLVVGRRPRGRLTKVPAAWVLAGLGLEAFGSASGHAVVLLEYPRCFQCPTPQRDIHTFTLPQSPIERGT